MAMSGTFHLTFDYVPGYTLSDNRCFSKSAVSRRRPSIVRLNCVPNHNSSSFVCRASSGGYRRNPDFSRLNKHGYQGRNMQNEERDDFDNESSRNGSSLSLSDSPKFQATSSPGPKEKEIVQVFRKVQSQLRVRAAAKKEDRKVEEASKGQGKESETVDSLLKLLRKHSDEQSKNKVSNFSNQGDDSNTMDRQDRSGKIFNSRNKDHNASSYTRPTSSFRRNSPVPRYRSPPAYSNEAAFDESSSYSVTWTQKKDKAESHDDPEEGLEAATEYENEPEDGFEPEAAADYEHEPEYESEPEPITTTLEPKSELKPESSSLYQEEDDEVTLDALSDDDVTLDVLSDDDDDDEEDGDETEEEDVKEEDLSTLKLIELRGIAKSRGLKGFSKMKKADLVELLGRNSS